MVSALRTITQNHAKRFAPRPVLVLSPSQALAAHSAVMSRRGIHLVEGEEESERTGHRPHMPWPRIKQSLTLSAPMGLVA